MSIRVKWEKNAEQWEALEMALPGRGRGILRLAGTKLGLCEEERETCLKYLHTSHIHIVEYISSTQPSLALISHDQMSFHMVHFKPLQYTLIPRCPTVQCYYCTVKFGCVNTICIIISITCGSYIHVICGQGRGMEY